MKIVLKDVNTSMLSENIEEVVKSVIEKLGVSEEVEKFSISADVYVKFHLVGTEEPMFIHTDRDLLGQPEIFTVVPEFDENGRLLSMEDNENETFEALAKSLSQELPTVAIESEFNDSDLTVFQSNEGGDIKEVIYDHKDGFKVIRYERAGVGLVAEMTATPKEEVEQC